MPSWVAAITTRRQLSIAASIAAAAAFREQRRGAWLSRAVLVTAEARLTSGAATLADLSAARTAAQRLETLGMTSAAVQGLLVTGRLAASFDRPRQAIAALPGWAHPYQLMPGKTQA